MARFKTVLSDVLGVVDVGTFQSYSPWGVLLGGVLDTDSKDVTVFNAQDAFAMAIRKAQESQYTISQFNGAISQLNTPTDDEANFYDSIQIVEDYAQWLWGDVASGGVFFFDPQDPNHSYEIVIMACNGCYAKDINGVTYYKYNIGGGAEPYRKYEELISCFFGYRWDSDSIGFVTMHSDGVGGTVPIPLLQYVETGGGYAPVGTVNSLDSINSTKKELVNLTPPPLMVRAVVLSMYGSNTQGGIANLGTIFDDENYELGDGWIKLHGTWFGDPSVPPQHNPGGGGDDDGDDGYEPSEDDTGETEEEQFTIDAINSGLVSIFNPTQSEIQEFGNFLFASLTEDIGAFLKRLISDPLEYVISLNMVHYHPVHNNTAEIKFAGIGSGVTSWLVSKQFQIMDFGTRHISPQGGTFLDYSGYTRIKCHMPYCGDFDLDCDIIMGADVSLKYIIDNLSGSCVAQLVIDNERLKFDGRRIKGQRYEFKGNVFEQVPLSASDYRSAISGLLTAFGGVGAIASGNPVSGVSAIASGVMSMKPHIQQASSVGSSFGYMGAQIPYIQVERPTNGNPPVNYEYRNGMPINTIEKLKNFEGFTQVAVGTFKTDVIPGITDEEGNELKQLLEDGVFL